MSRSFCRSAPPSSGAWRISTRSTALPPAAYSAVTSKPNGSEHAGVAAQQRAVPVDRARVIHAFEIEPHPRFSAAAARFPPHKSTICSRSTRIAGCSCPHTGAGCTGAVKRERHAAGHLRRYPARDALERLARFHAVFAGGTYGAVPLSRHAHCDRSYWLLHIGMPPLTSYRKERLGSAFRSAPFLCRSYSPNTSLISAQALSACSLFSSINWFQIASGSSK